MFSVGDEVLVVKSYWWEKHYGRPMKKRPAKIIHTKMTGTPEYMYQVIFIDEEGGTLYLEDDTCFAPKAVELV